MSDGLTKSARRVFDILELFRERQSPLRLKDVVDALGMPTSSAAALLKTMAQMNYLSFESNSRAYLPTPKLSQLSDWLRRRVMRVVRSRRRCGGSAASSARPSCSAP